MLKVNLQRDQLFVKMFCTKRVVCGWYYNFGGGFAVAFKFGLAWKRKFFAFFWYVSAIIRWAKGETVVVVMFNKKKLSLDLFDCFVAVHFIWSWILYSVNVFCIWTLLWVRFFWQNGNVPVLWIRIWWLVASKCPSLDADISSLFGLFKKENFCFQFFLLEVAVFVWNPAS